MRKHLLKTTAAAVVTIAAMTGCSNPGSDTGGSTSTPLVVAGGFSGVSLAAHQEDNGYYSPMATTDYTMVCAMLVSPYTSGSSALNSSGAFELTIAGGAGQPIGCFLTKSGAIAAVIEFQSTSGFSDSSGGAAYNPESGATKITFPSTLSISNGVVAVNTSLVTNTGGSGSVAGSWSDPTGTWSITGHCENKYNETTKAYESKCNGAMGGDMPTSVYLKQISATKDSDGTVKYGLSVWESAAARTACGDREGLMSLTGWTAVGGWDTAFTGTPDVDLTTLSNVNAWAAVTKAQAYNGQGVCNATITDGVTLCSDNVWTGTGANWGMSDAACKLNCVMSAIQRGQSYVTNWGSGVTCPLRYEMDWSKGNQFSNDVDYNSGNGTAAGDLNDGKCDGAKPSYGGGCADTFGTMLSADRGPEKRFTFGELFISGNIGTVVSKENIRTNTFYNRTTNSSVECKLQRIEKMTISQVSATKAEVTVESQMINHTVSANMAACAANEDFTRWMSDVSSMSIKLTKQ